MLVSCQKAFINNLEYPADAVLNSKKGYIMFKSILDYPWTAVITFTLVTAVCSSVFLYTLGIDVSYPQSSYAGILPLVWHFTPQGESPDFWDILGSGAMTCLCIFGKAFHRRIRDNYNWVFAVPALLHVCEN
jgi:hypothetical protein